MLTTVKNCNFAKRREEKDKNKLIYKHIIISYLKQTEKLFFGKNDVIEKKIVLLQPNLKIDNTYKI